MAQGKQAQQRKRKQLEARRRREKKLRQSPAPVAKQLAPQLAQQIEEAYELIGVRRFGQAEQLLDRLDKRNPAVVEAQLFLYQANHDHESCCAAAKTLTNLTPRDPEARLMYAQASMFCGRIATALANYRLFLERWPEHANAQKAKNAIELVEPECEASIQNLGIGDAGFDALLMHEESLARIQSGNFEKAVEKCLQLLKLAPEFMSARNNLALAYFQSGNIEQAVHVAEETCRLAPNNRFSEATLGKLRFLSGQEQEANAIADRIVADPPREQDSLTVAMELLSFLGRDENVVVLSEAATDLEDPRSRAIVLHHLAVAQYRLGDEKAARSSWKKCLQAMPSHTEARENLDDLDSGKGHAPWANSAAKWIPRAVCDKMFDSKSGKTEHFDLTKDHPTFAALIPALLDRGHPVGRELAFRMAMADGSPAMLDALQQFAFGSRGPDAMRSEALNMLRKKGRVNAGPHRLYSHGKWTDVKLFMPEIYWQAEERESPWVQELIDTGTEALNNGDFALAEESFSRVLDRDPDHCSAAYNLCVVWLRRDGTLGLQRARARLEEIHEQHPDYLFATISLAQFAAMDGDFDRARDLLDPILDATRLHASEATALFTVQVQIAIKRREFESARQALELLTHIADDDDPNVAILRRRLDAAASKRKLSRRLSWK